MYFQVIKKDLLNGQKRFFYFDTLWIAKIFVWVRTELMKQTGFIYEYKIKLVTNHGRNC